jgi:hypothetical protein
MRLVTLVWMLRFSLRAQSAPELTIASRMLVARRTETSQDELVIELFFFGP